jgi:hypothetical protein
VIHELDGIVRNDGNGLGSVHRSTENDRAESEHAAVCVAHVHSRARMRSAA